jgi:hypothetical protein
LELLSDDVSIKNEYLRLKDDDPFAKAAQLSLSTLLLDTITLMYDWRREDSPDSRDRLVVEWKPTSASDWIELVSHVLRNADSFASATWSLSPGANNLAGIDIRFRLSSTDGSISSSDGARADNVKLTGEMIFIPPPPPVDDPPPSGGELGHAPEPMSLLVWLALIGCCGVAGVRRRATSAA